MQDPTHYVKPNSTRDLLQPDGSVCIGLQSRSVFHFFSHHHGEDGQELFLRDAVVAVEIVHPEGDWNVKKRHDVQW